MSPYEIINALLLLSSLTYNAVGQKANGNHNNPNNNNNSNNNNNNNNFKPSKDLYSVNGSNNSNHAVNTRYFQTNFGQFYNNPYPKYNSFFYPSPSFQTTPNSNGYYGHGNNNNNYQRQIRVPGLIEIRILGNNAEITCEFDRYLILVQGIYWHHNVDPYGSYFDTRNGFAPHITVTNVNAWKSVLTIKDFTDDDAGPYRCISTAILPDDNHAHNSNNNNNQLNLNINKYYGYPEVRTNQMEESKRKVRFTRELKDETNFNPVYDPFLSNYLGGLNLNHNPHLQHQLTPLHNNNYLQGNNNYFPGNYNQNYMHTNPFGINPGFNNYENNWNVHAPYYKPSYSVSVVYQEVIFPVTSSTTLSPGK